MNATRKSLSWPRRVVLLIPYTWLVAFILVPTFIVLRMSVSEMEYGMPPYTPVYDPAAGLAGVKDFLAALTLENYARFVSEGDYFRSYLNSVQIALISTAILLLIGFPVAYGIARAPRRLQSILLMLVVLPFWTSFLIRIYAWITILQHDGPLNRTLLAFGLVQQAPVWLTTDTAVYIGIVYSYLPFMVLPIYATVEKLDQTLLEAAADLGCPPWKSFWLVTLPLAMRGVIAGVLLCFIPIVGEFVIPGLLGGSDTLMIGQTLWMEFYRNTDWPLASAIAIMLLLLLLGPIMIYQHLQMRELEARR
jgi:putrescine transport system permease protein